MANARQFLAARTTAWAKSGAPLPYDAEVEYLETDGTAMIDSGVSFTGEVAAEVEFIMSGVFFVIAGKNAGAIGFGRANAYTYSLKTTTSSVYIYLGNPNGSFSIPITSKDKADFSLETDDVNPSILNAVYDGMSYSRTRYNDSFVYGEGVNCGVLGIIFRTAIGSFQKLSCASGSRVYSVYIKNKKTCQEFSGIPVRVGQTGYLYDTVSGSLFGNARDTGAFIIGPDKTT